MIPLLEGGPVFRPEEVEEQAKEGARVLELFQATPRLNSWIYSKLASGVRGDVLEIGSGTGNLSRLIMRDAERAMLTDGETHYLDRLRRDLADGERVQISRFDVEREPPPTIAARRFDSIVAVNVIEHLRNDEAAVTRLVGLLKPSGKLLIYVPACPFAYGPIDRAVGHYRRYTASSLMSLVRAAGLRPDPPRYVNFVGLIGWFISGRILRRRTISSRQVALFERMINLVRIEDRLRLPLGLGLVIHASLPAKDSEAVQRGGT